MDAQTKHHLVTGREHYQAGEYERARPHRCCTIPAKQEASLPQAKFPLILAMAEPGPGRSRAGPLSYC